nr:hypothetical protein GCM10017611_67880 [Rhodococcus wratislaviensis]
MAPFNLQRKSYLTRPAIRFYCVGAELHLQTTGDVLTLQLYPQAVDEGFDAERVIVMTGERARDGHQPGNGAVLLKWGIRLCLSRLISTGGPKGLAA